MDNTASPVCHDPVATHQAAFANMPNMVPFVKVLNAFNKDCPYLEYANQLVNTLQRGGVLIDKIPARIYHHKTLYEPLFLNT